MWRDTGFAVGALLAGLVADLAGLEAAVWVVAASRPLRARRGRAHVRDPPSGGQDMTAGTGGPLRFATFLAPNMLPVYRFLADQIAHRLGRPVQLVVGHSFDQFERQADLGVIQTAMCGWPTAAPAGGAVGCPVLAGDRYAGRPIYYSDVIVHRDSPILRLEELRGCSWAYNEPASHSGHTVTLYSLVQRGVRPGFLGRVVEAGFHQRAIRLVAAGAVDAAAIDSQVLAIERRDQARAGRPPPRHRHLRALHHPTRRGRQPPPPAAEG